MNEQNKKKIVNELIETFLNAGKLTLKLREKGLKETIKEDNTPVTNADIEVNKIISEKIFFLDNLSVLETTKPKAMLQK